MRPSKPGPRFAKGGAIVPLSQIDPRFAEGGIIAPFKNRSEIRVGRLTCRVLCIRSVWPSARPRGDGAAGVSLVGCAEPGPGRRAIYPTINGARITRHRTHTNRTRTQRRKSSKAVCNLNSAPPAPAGCNLCCETDTQGNRCDTGTGEMRCDECTREALGNGRDTNE